VPEVIRKLGVTEQQYYPWKWEYSSLRKDQGKQQAGGRNEGLRLPLPASLPEYQAPSRVRGPVVQVRSTEWSALSAAAKTSLSTGC